MIAAVGDLLRCRLVVRRRAPCRRGDPRIAQLQAIVRASRERLVGEPVGEEGGHQEVARPAGAIAGEDAPGAIGAMRRWRETDERNPRARIAKPRHRPAPIRLVPECGALFARDPRTELAQTWAT